MALKLSRNKFLGIKNETTQNTLATVGVGDFITIQDVTFKLGKNTVERDYKRGSLDTLSSVVAERWAEIEATVELRNSGSNGYPELESLFTCCGNTVTYATTTSSINPISTAMTGMLSPATSSTVVVHLDGIKHVAQGCVGTAKGTLEAGKVPMVTFTLKGLYSGSCDQANPVVEGLVTTAPPIVQSITLKVGSYSPIAVSKVDWDLGTETAMLSDVNSANAVYGFLVTGRKPTITLNPVVDTIGNHDAIAAMIAGTEYSMSCQIGTAASNCVEVIFPQVQYTEVTNEDRSGVLGYAITGKANGSGNNSYSFRLH